MALSVFDDKARPPQSGELRPVLGPAGELWEELVARVAAAWPPVVEEWNFTGAKYGWSMRLRRNERVILYLIPQAGHFLVGVVLGEKAVRAAPGAGLPAAVLELIERAPRYAEGRGFRLPIATREDLAAAEQLAALKMSK